MGVSAIVTLQCIVVDYRSCWIFSVGGILGCFFATIVILGCRSREQFLDVCQERA